MAKLGPRTTVAVGKDKAGKAVFSYMLESTAKYFGFPFEKNIVTRKNKKGYSVPIRGAVGQGHIKIPTGKTKKVGKNTITLYKQVPMPGSMNIAKIGAFLKKATKNKPNSFVSQDGVTYSV
jgi:hypothetical protein